MVGLLEFDSYVGQAFEGRKRWKRGCEEKYTGKGKECLKSPFMAIRWGNAKSPFDHFRPLEFMWFAFQGSLRSMFGYPLWRGERRRIVHLFVLEGVRV